MNVRSSRSSTLAVGLLAAFAVVAAVPASADATDDAVIATLAKRNILITDRDTTIAQAHQVCTALDKHYKSSVLAMKLVKDTDLSLKESSYFIGVAVSAYCPQHSGRTDSSTNWLNPAPPLM
jgi:hypothetical protein